MGVAENRYYNKLASILAGFKYNGGFYHFYAHPYNATWMNERQVEIPVFKRLLQACRGRVLEVGNVLGHYMSVEHTVVDLFEQGPGVLNVDILDYHPEARFDLIISISTLEHIGRDDEPRPGKVVEAIDHLKGLLSPGGKLVVSAPIGYNGYLDERLPMLFDSVYYLLRDGQYRWRQVDSSTIRGVEYNERCGANAVAFGYYEKV